MIYAAHFRRFLIRRRKRAFGICVKGRQNDQHSHDDRRRAAARPKHQEQNDRDRGQCAHEGQQSTYHPRGVSALPRPRRRGKRQRKRDDESDQASQKRCEIRPVKFFIGKERKKFFQSGRRAGKYNFLVRDCRRGRPQRENTKKRYERYRDIQNFIGFVFHIILRFRKKYRFCSKDI